MGRRKRTPLTKARQQEGGTFYGEPLTASAAVAARYAAQLRKCIASMHAETLREIGKLYAVHGPATDAMDASLAAQARILTNALAARFTSFFSKLAPGLAKNFADNVDRHSKSNLHFSLKEMSGGISLKTSVISPAIRQVQAATVAQNVQLIKSIPQEYFNRITGAVMREIQSGTGVEGLFKFIQATKTVTDKRADLIARDQNSKATTALNDARLKALGVREFEWLHSGGGKEPRPLHLDELDGNIYSLDDPPVIDDKTGEKGLPGQLINCGCTMIPVIKFGSNREQT